MPAVIGDRGIARGDAGGDDDLVEAREIVARSPRCRGGLSTPVFATIVSNQAMRPRNSSLPGTRAARCNCPPTRGALSNRVTRCPRPAAVIAAASPAGPAPTTAMVFGASVGAGTISVSKQARGLTRQVLILPGEGVVEAGLVAGDAGRDLVRPPGRRLGDEIGIGEERAGHADHVGGARRRAAPSATSGVLIRFEAISGRPTLPMSFWVTQAKAARGTEVAMVGTRASCQPIPELRRVAPAASTARASVSTSSKVEPSGTRSIIDSR